MTAEATIDRTSTAVTPFEETFRAFEESDSAQAPASVQALRSAAFDVFRKIGFPTTKNEDWHYTSVAPIVEHERRDVAPFSHGGSGIRRPEVKHALC